MEEKILLLCTHLSTTISWDLHCCTHKFVQGLIPLLLGRHAQRATAPRPV